MSTSNMQQELPKLSKKETIILDLLVENEEMFGLEMVKASEGNLKRGSIYVLLSRMADKGYVESREEPRKLPEIGIPRRKFMASDLGKRVHRANEKAQEFFAAELALEGLQ